MIRIDGVNQRIREAVILELHRRRMPRTKLAEQAGLNANYLSRMLAGERDGGRAAWESVLDALDLELAAVPKSKVS